MTATPAEQREYNRALIAEFRASGGALPDRPLLLLTTTGAKTGQQRTSPMMYVRVDDHLLVIASNAGSAKHPDWLRNLVADPAVTVEMEGRTFSATARVASGAHRERLWRQICQQYPFFADHQAGIEREIPVVELVEDRDRR